MPVTVHQPVMNTYAVDAPTLAEVEELLRQHDEAGLAEWNPQWEVDYGDDGNVTEVRIEVHTSIQMPEWPQYGSASSAARTEWDRFHQALLEHEEGHIDLVRTHFADLEGQMVGRSYDDATAAYQAVFDALTQASADYDASTSHGQNTGVHIDTSVDGTDD